MDGVSISVSESKVATYDLDEGELIMDGLTEAFTAVGYDLAEKEPPLIDYIDPHVVDKLQAQGSDYCLVTSIWQHPVSITRDRITVYEATDRRTPE